MERVRRRWWTRLITISALAILLAAVVSLMFRFAVDAVPGYRGKVESAVGAAIGRPVSIGSMALVWSRLRPTLEFHDLAVLDRDTRTPLLSVTRLRMGTGFSRLLHGETMPSWIEINGVKVDADVDLEGRWTIRGIDLAAKSSGESPLKSIDRIDRLQVDGVHCELRDQRLGPQARLQPLTLDASRIDLHRRQDRYALEAALKPPPEIAASALLHAELTGQPADATSWKGLAVAQVEGLRGWPWLAAALPADLQIVIDGGQATFKAKIEAGTLAQIDADAAATAVTAQRNGQTAARATQLRIAATATPVAADSATAPRQWTIDIPRIALTGEHGPWPDSAKAQIQLTHAPSGWGVDARADFLRLDDLVPWAALDGRVPADVARISGDLGAVHLRLDALIDPSSSPACSGCAPTGHTAASHPAITFDTDIHQLALKPQGNHPALSGLDGSLHVENDQGHLTLRNATPTLSLPELFSQPITVSSISTQLAWQHLKDGSWTLSAPEFVALLPGAKAKGSLDLKLPHDGKTPPQMKLLADLSSDDATRLKSLMPLTWGEKTREWLTRALVKGRVPRGHLVVDSPLVPRNEEHPDGTVWTLELDVADGTLAFHPDWPAAEQMQAHLSFRDHGLKIVSKAARIDGAPVQQVDALIPDFHEPVLTIEGHSVGEAADYYRLLRDSPLHTRLAGLLNKTEARGPAAVDLHLEIPLHTEHTEVQVSGTVDFGDAEHGAELTVKGLAQPVTDVRGQLAFGKGVTAENLTGRAFETPLSAVIREQKTAEGKLDDTLIASFDTGPQDEGGPMQVFVPGWLRSSFKGRSHFELRLPFSGPDSGRVTVASDLVGITSWLPPPLGKAAADTLPLTVTIGGGSTTTEAPAPLRILIAAREDAVRVALRLVNDEAGESRTRGVEVRVGPGETPLAATDGVVVTGEPPELDGPAWAAALAGIGAGGSKDGSLAFRSADLRPGTLKLHNTALRGVHLLSTGVGEGGVHTVVSGENAAGTVDWLRDSGSHLEIDLQRLALDAVSNAPTPKGLVDAAENKDRPEQTPFEPGRAPVLDVRVGALSVGGVELGQLRLQTARIDDGQQIEQLKLAGGKLDVDAQGRWRRTDGRSSAEVKFDLASTDIGDVLKALGYAQTLAAARAKFSGALAWSPAPEGLELAQARGGLQLAVEKGSLKAVEPGGTGRMLGLINLYALPRRLLLDFRDVAGQGLGFDTLKGSFKLADGQATTDDLDIVNPSLKIELRGRIGLAARDYDQRVTVRPDLSTGVTVGATLLGGPIAGGIALVIQQLAGKPLSALTQFSYRVTGSWDDPHVDKTGDKSNDTQPVPAKGVSG